MITFLDHADNEYGALTEISYTNGVNGERSIKGEIYSNDKVLGQIDRGWRLRFEDEYYVVTYAKPIDTGSKVQVSFDAVHQFFWDFSKTSVYNQLSDGSHTFHAYLEFIFAGSGYSYYLEVNVKAFEKQSFGYKKRLTLFNDIISQAGVEFSVKGKVVRILERVGTDLSTIVRKNLNLDDLRITKNIGEFITYQKGFGKWKDDKNHSKGRLEVEYESPLAKVYGRLEGEPVVDERYTSSDSLLEVLKKNVDNSYSLSVELAMEDLKKAGYAYQTPRAGDYIMVINETMQFQERVRIVSFTSQYDIKGQLIDHKVTCNDIGAVKKQSAQNNFLKNAVGDARALSLSAFQSANSALVSADGKNTVYFGTEMPVDIPKGTLIKGDTLYLTVGDVKKMYFWNGAEWEEPPVVNDIEKFKRDIEKRIDTVNAEIVENNAEHDRKVSEALSKAGANQLLAEQSKKLAEEIKTALDVTSQDLSKYKQDNEQNLSILRNKIVQENGETRLSLAELNQTARELTKQFADVKISLDNKVSVTDFQSVKETSKLYERIIGTSDDNISSNIARMALTSELFNVEVGKAFTTLTNLVYAPTKLPKYMSSVATDKHLQRVGWGDHDGIRINYQTSMSGWLGVRFPLTKKFVTAGERLAYRIELAVDVVPENSMIFIQLLDNTSGLGMYYNSSRTITSTGNHILTGYIDIPKTGELNEYSLRFTLTKPGNIVIHKPMIVDGAVIPDKFVDSTDYNGEYTRTTMSLLKDSFAVKTLNSNGDVLSALNLATGGASLQVGDNKLIVTPDTTYIANSTIKSAMIDTLDAGKINTGTLNAAKVNVINLNASNITSGKLSANLISGGVLTALNGNTTLNLQSGILEYNTGNATKMVLNTSGLHYTDSNGSLLGWLGRANTSYQGTYGVTLNLSVAAGKELALGYNAGSQGYSPALTVNGTNGLVKIHNGIQVSDNGARVKFVRGNGFTIITNGNGNSGIIIGDNGNLQLLKNGTAYEVK